MTTRRGFIAGALAFIAAPAIVRATNIMPVRALRADIVPLNLEGKLPGGWLLCDGSALPKHLYPELSATIGEFWGSDKDTVNLPDLRGWLDDTCPGVTNFHMAISTSSLSTGAPVGSILPIIAKK